MKIKLNDSDEVLRRIYDLRGMFIYKRNLRPNAVYLGTTEWHLVVQVREPTVHFSFLREPEVFGMRIHRMLTDSHISLGYVIEGEVEENG